MRRKCVGDAEVAVERGLEVIEGGAQGGVSGGGRVGGEGVGDSVSEAAVGVGLGDPVDQRLDFGDLLAGVGDGGAGVQFGDLTGGESEELAAIKLATAGGAGVVNRAVLVAVGGTGLVKRGLVAAAFDSQAEGDEGARGVGGLERDAVEEGAVTAHAAGGAEGGGRGRRS